MKLKLKYCLFAISIAIVLAAKLYTQDTTKPAPKLTSKKDTAYVQNFILADHRYLYLNPSNPDTVTRKRFLWYPAKTLEDIFNYVPGYYLYFMDVGQINYLSYNQLNLKNIGVMRNGRPINDMIDGSVDMNLLSRNEISEFELSNGYRNNIYDYANSINIIQRELFQFRPYTEISFYQDRYENIYFDGNFHQNFSKKLNFNFGITKHSYDGKYLNSGFDKWLGRFNLTFAPSNKLNFFLKVNYSKIERDLNEGINPDTVDISNKSDLFDEKLAIPFYVLQDEKKERFDIDAGAVISTGKHSYSKLQLYTSNSFRKIYRNGVWELNDHWINYGAKGQQKFGFELIKQISLNTNTEAEISRMFTQSDGSSQSTSANNSTYLRFLQEVSLSYKNLNLQAFLRGFTYSFINDYYETKLFYTFFLRSGLTASIFHDINKDSKIVLRGTYNNSDNYSSISADFINRVITFGSEFYYYRSYRNYPFTLFVPPKVVYRGINSNIDLRFFKFRLNALHQYTFRNTTDLTFPEHSGRINLSFEDNAFKDKLEYKIGLTTRFWSKSTALFYFAYGNYFIDHYYSQNSGSYKSIEIPANATLDFYIMGKIGKATFGLTFENILDRIIYNTGVYPFTDRGGLFNSLSRFNITWNFFD